MRSSKEIQLIKKLEEAAQANGFDLVDVELVGSGQSALLRVFIDKAEGLNLDEIAEANSWVSEVVEGVDPYKGSYTLEVSSPGIDRPLRTLEHFERALGERAVITLDGALVLAGGLEQKSSKEGKPRHKYTGVITQVDLEEQLITLELEEGLYTLEFAHIKKARIKGHLDFEKRKDS